jgi:tetratricopeptide (TPR) repeat protein
MMRRRKPFQRGYAEQALPLVKTIRDQQQVLTTEDADDPATFVAAHGQIGEAYRALGQLEPARRHLEKAVAEARAHGLRKQLGTNLVRLATALQYADAHEAAMPLFEEALVVTAETGVALDFAHQHLGKCLAELGRWGEAIGHFEQALAMRQARGDAGLIASTEEALEAARAIHPGPAKLAGWPP